MEFDDESLAYARAVEALRHGFVALGWTAFPEVRNATKASPKKATVRLIGPSGERGGCGFNALDVAKDVDALHALLEETARKCGMGDTAYGHRALDIRWREWTPEWMRHILGLDLSRLAAGGAP